MKRHNFSIVEKALDLHKMKKRNPGFFKSPEPKRPVGRPMKRENVLKGLRAIKAKLNAPEQLQLLARQLTGGGQGMKLKEFRYYPYPGNPYGNPEDFAREREKERRGGMIKAGLIGAGLLAGGALAGRGLFKAGISAAGRRADALEKELLKVRSAAPADVPTASIPKPQVRAPQPPPSSADKAILKVGKKTPAVAPTVKAVENLQKSGAISSADAAAEVGEALAAKPRKLTPRQEVLKKRQERIARAAAKPAPVASKAPAPQKPKPEVQPKFEKPAVLPAAKEEFWEQPGVGKVPLTGTAQSNAALRQELDKLHGAGEFKGKVAADVIEDARKRVSEAENLSRNSEGLREIAKAQGKKPANTAPPAQAPIKAGRKPANISSAEKAKLDDEFEKEMGKSGKSATAKKSKAPANSEPSTFATTTADVSNITPAQRRALQSARREKKARRLAKLAANSKKKKKTAKKLAAILRGVREFNFQTDEGGIPFTGKVAKDRFIKKLRDEDLDRRDANILRAGAAGAVAGLLFRGRLSRGKRALIGAGLGGAGVIGTRMATDRTRDIYGERSRGAKRAEALPALAGLGTAGWLATRRIRGLAAKLRGVRLFNHRGHRGHGGLKEFSILNKISNFTGMAQIKAGREALARAKSNRRLRDIYRADAIKQNKFPYKDSDLQYTIESGMRHRAIGSGFDAKYNIREARNLINEGRRRRNISIGVGAGVAGLGAGAGYLATRKESKLAAKIRGVKEFGSMGLKKLYRKEAAIVREIARNSTWDGKSAAKSKLLKQYPRLEWKTGAAKGRWEKLGVYDKARYTPDGLRGLYPSSWQFLAARLRGVKEFARGFNSAKLLPSERWQSVRDPFSGWVSQRQLPAPEKHSDYSKYVADKMRAVRSEMRRLNGGNIPYIQRARELKAERARAQAIKSQEWGLKAQAQLPDYYFANQSRLSARLRGLKEFEDYKLYYFRGRNTGIAARSAEEARKKKKRGGDELVAVRTPNATEKSQMARGIWVRTRRDGKSPEKSRYGKGRGQGPARKSMGAKIRGVKEFSMISDGPSILASMNNPDSPFYVPPEKREEQRLRAKEWHRINRLRHLASRKESNLASRLRTVKFFEKKKEKKSGGLNPYVGAALSGFGSGAALGSLALLRRGATFRSAAKTAAKLGIASAGIVGGGALLGSKIIGNPRDDESAPFTKRAAIGGALVGSGAGLAGALLLRKTKGGSRALVGASKKTEPFSRPAMWLRKSPIAGAAGIGAVGGALYGGAMGADEGQQVDSIRNLRKDIKAMSRRLRGAQRFFGRSDQPRWYSPGTREHGQFGDVKTGWVEDRPMFTEIKRTMRDGQVVKEAIPWEPSSPQLVNALLRDAKRQRVNVQRGGNLTRDVFDEVRGVERRRDASGRIKKREWEKSWFQNKAAEIGIAAAGGAGLLAARYAHNNPDTKIGQAYSNTKLSLRETKRNAADIGGRILKSATRITARRFSANLARLRELDAMAEYYGWDVRDPRGRSARVFAPGSRRRERRQKEWHEKTENERKLWKAGLVASALGGAGALLVGQRLVSGKSLIPSRFIPKRPVVDPEKVVTGVDFKKGAA